MTDYILKYTGAYLNDAESSVKPKKIKILGDCSIMNYDPRVTSTMKKGLIKIDFSNGQTKIKEGVSGDSTPNIADFSAKKAKVLVSIAALGGDKKAIDIEDISKIKSLNKSEFGLIDIKADVNAGVATLVWGENDVLRIDFETENEKKLNNSSIENTSNTSKDRTDKNDSIAFLQDLGAQETKGIKNPYACKNKYGYVGLYQMGEQAMADMGIYKKEGKYNNDWTGIFVQNKYGITSLWDYMNSPEKQDKLQIDYKKKNWGYIQRYGLDSYIGTTINGIKITASGLLAGAHLVGIGGLKKFLHSNGEENVTDATGTSISKYIAQFAGYDVSSITS